MAKQCSLLSLPQAWHPVSMATSSQLVPPEQDLGQAKTSKLSWDSTVILSNAAVLILSSAPSGDSQPSPLSPSPQQVTSPPVLRRYSCQARLETYLHRNCLPAPGNLPPGNSPAFLFVFLLRVDFRFLQTTKPSVPAHQSSGSSGPVLPVGQGLLRDLPGTVRQEQDLQPLPRDSDFTGLGCGHHAKAAEDCPHSADEETEAPSLRTELTSLGAELGCFPVWVVVKHTCHLSLYDLPLVSPWAWTASLFPRTRGLCSRH